jgi:hypothetical protein
MTLKWKVARLLLIVVTLALALGLVAFYRIKVHGLIKEVKPSTQ